MNLPFFQVNAFTRELTGGNPAGVCIVKEWPSETKLRRIASGGVYPEIAFILPKRNAVEIRWFSPRAEVDLCGHATLAAAHVLFNHRDFPSDEIRFEYADGVLPVTRDGDALLMSLPARVAVEARAPDLLIEALGREPAEVLRATDYMAVFKTEAAVRKLTPHLRRLAQLRERGVIATAPGQDVDFVSRFFAPSLGIEEDHVTGSAHCTLAPYWAERLKKKRMKAKQLSPRGGELECEVVDDRVLLRGHAVTYFIGELMLD